MSSEPTGSSSLSPSPGLEALDQHWATRDREGLDVDLVLGAKRRVLGVDHLGRCPRHPSGGWVCGACRMAVFDPTPRGIPLGAACEICQARVREPRPRNLREPLLGSRTAWSTLAILLAAAFGVTVFLSLAWLGLAFLHGHAV